MWNCFTCGDIDFGTLIPFHRFRYLWLSLLTFSVWIEETPKIIAKIRRNAVKCRRQVHVRGISTYITHRIHCSCSYSNAFISTQTKLLEKRKKKPFDFVAIFFMCMISKTRNSRRLKWIFQRKMRFSLMCKNFSKLFSSHTFQSNSLKWCDSINYLWALQETRSEHNWIELCILTVVWMTANKMSIQKLK